MWVLGKLWVIFILKSYLLLIWNLYLFDYFIFYLVNLVILYVRLNYVKY